MMNKNFTVFVPTRLLFGCGQLNQLHVQKLPGNKAMIVTSNGSQPRITLATSVLSKWHRLWEYHELTSRKTSSQCWLKCKRTAAWII